MPAPVGKLLLPIFWLFSGLVAVVARQRNKFYDKNPVVSDYPFRIVSIGNLGVGGTGKTPLGLLFAKRALESKLKVAILLRGYGSKEGFSDEAELYKKTLGVKHVFINPDRNASLRQVALQNYDLVLMDDAFQHRRAPRDLDIVVMDAKHVVLDDEVMPLGMLREPVEGLRRAQVLVMTRCESLSEIELDRLRARVRERFPRLNIIVARTKVSSIEACFSQLEFRPQAQAYLYSGLGDPQKFRETVLACGVLIVGESVFPDHHFLTEVEIESMVKQAQKLGAEVILTTAKDAVKLKQELVLPVFVVNIDFELEKEASCLRLVFKGEGI